MGQAPRVNGPPVGVGLRFDVSMWPLVVVWQPRIYDYLQQCYEDVFAQPNRHALIVAGAWGLHGTPLDLAAAGAQ